MSTPSDPQWGAGNPPGGWQPPQYGQPQYGQPQQQPYPPYQQPPQPDQQWGQQQWGQQQWQPQDGGQWSGGPVPLAPPPSRKGRGKLVAAAAAAVVVIGGGVATYAAVSSSSGSGGADNPQAAVKGLVADLDNSDLVGVLDDLPPGERDAISKPFEQTVESLKRNDVLRPDADLSNVGGVNVNASNLTFASKTITINDHVRVVQLTGGHISVNADAAKAPFTSDFLKAVAPDGLANANGSTSVDISDVVHRTGKPIRIAAQESGGRWYPSLLYTIADNATTSSGLQAPAASDRIPAVGASSADDAVRSLIQALLQANVERAAELLSPDELGVIHDYGKLILDRVHYSAPDVQLKDLQFTDHPVSGGTRVTVKSLDIVAGGSEVKMVLDGSCANVTAQGQSRRLCSSDLLGLVSSGPFGQHLTAAQHKALNDLFSGFTNAAGLDTSQSGGKWYVNPVRSYFDLANAMLSGLRGDDGKQLLALLTH